MQFQRKWPSHGHAASPMAAAVWSAFMLLHALNVQMCTKAMWKRKELGQNVL